MSRVLIVDDDPTHQFLAKTLLTNYNYFDEYKCYTDPKSALIDLIDAYFASNVLPDAILLDLNMPGVNGWEFLEIFNNLKALVSKEIPVFIVTSSIDPNDKMLSERYPVIKSFFSKPLSPAILNSIVSAISFNPD